MGIKGKPKFLLAVFTTLLVFLFQNCDSNFQVKNNLNKKVDTTGTLFGSEVLVAKTVAIDQEQIGDLIQRGIDIGHSHDLDLTLYLTPSEFDQLSLEGWRLEIIEKQYPGREISQFGEISLFGSYTHNTQYPKYSDLKKSWINLCNSKSHICSYKRIGFSVQDRPIFAFKITDNPGNNELEPKVLYASTMHGDEWTSVPVVDKIFRKLLNGYGSNSQINRIVNNVETWIIPIINPDGYMSKSRYNVNGFDLNRNFPDIYKHTGSRQPETKTVMNFVKSIQFSIAINFHSGALVMNYPYDGNAKGENIYTATKEDEVYRSLALAYAKKHGPMFESDEFTDGITNGADWYVIYGGLQDWLYRKFRVLSFTLEVHDDRYLDLGTSVTNLKNYNTRALLNNLEYSLRGAKGFIFDSTSNKKIANSIIQIKSSDGFVRNIKVDSRNKGYFRYLLPGTYQIRASANGYKTSNWKTQYIGSGSAKSVNFYLSPN